VANVISTFLHSELKEFNKQLNNTQLSNATRQIFAQSYNVVVQEINSFESWFISVTQSKTPTATLINQLNAFATSFRNAERKQVPAQVNEYKNGQTIANTSSSFTFINPSFWGNAKNKYHQGTLAGSAGTTFSPVTVSPAITLQPSNQTGTVGGNATFNAT